MYISNYIQNTSFYLGRFIKHLINRRSMLLNTMYQACPYNLLTTGLTWNWMLNKSIYYVWYLHIPCFYSAWQSHPYEIMITLWCLTSDTWTEQQELTRTLQLHTCVNSINQVLPFEGSESDCFPTALLKYNVGKSDFWLFLVDHFLILIYCKISNGSP